MSMKKNVIVLLVLACLPLWVVAQNTNDDLYFIPPKKVEKKEETVEKKSVATTGYVAPGTPIVVKDVKGNVRDVDEYNRRYTSRDNYFSMENDTLYIEEKPYNERGEWVNGFNGSQSDYEYAMRIVRFQNPSYAIPVSSPLYWEIVYGSPSWEWNVFEDGFYAYVFPTFSNSLWWNWRWNWNWGWGPSWHYGWHYPYWGFGSHWHHPYGHYGYHHLHHYHHGWAGTGGYWGKKHGWNGSTATRPGIHAGRYKNSYQGRYASTGTSNRRVVTGENRNSRDRYVNGVRQSTNRGERTNNRVSSGRVVTAKDGTGSSSVRPQRSATRTRTDGQVTQKNNGEKRGNNTYTRPTEGRGSSYTRQSSTRSTVKNNTPSYRRKSEAAERGAYRNNSSATRSSESRSSYENSSSSSSSRSSYSSGSSSRSSRSSAGGASSRSGGGNRSARR